ncbi:5'-3' exonuclease [Jatrophihabitans sp. DSM 45814]
MPQTDPPVVLAVDGNSLVHRSFHALAGTGMRSAAGQPIWAVRGLLTQLVAAVARVNPSAIVVGFDDPVASTRRERWPQYKANRTEKLATLVDQLELAVVVLRDLGVHVVVPDGLEADDVLASAALSAGTAGARTVIMTSDRDSFALIDETTSVLRIINGGVEASPLLTPERLLTMLGVRPEQYRDFAALRGDPSDNLPGVRGIGPKTAAKLLTALGSARGAFDDLESGGNLVAAAVGTGAAAKLADPAARQAWELNCQVMRLHSYLDLGLEFEADLDREANCETNREAGSPPAAASRNRVGALPLDEHTVRAAFTEQQLPATLPSALRALAHVEVAADAPVMASERSWASSASRDAARSRNWPPGSSTGGATGWSRQKYGRIPKKPEPPKSEQLSLFG